MMTVLDLKSFRALFERQYLKVCNYIQVKASCDWAQCELIARQAFVSLWKGRDNMNLERSPLSVLLEIVRQRLFVEYGIPTQIKQHDDDKTNSGRSSGRPVPRLDWAVNQLDPSTREIFLLRKQKNFTTQEIAEMMDTSVQIVEEHLKKALVELRILLIEAMPSSRDVQFGLPHR